MSPATRWSIALGLVLVDLVVYVLPLTGLMAAYLLLVRPPWFRAWVRELYEA